MNPHSFILLIIAILAVDIRAYKNPVQGSRDSPDPGVVYDGQFYYSVTTEGWDGHYFPVWRSKDLFNFTHEGWVFMKKPSWAVSDFWAPEIHIIGHSYAVYYTARDSSGHLCIGVGYSDKPTGPFIDKGAPLLRNATEGVIDPTIYQYQNGSIYLIYKVDGNAHGKPTEIYALQLTSDGKSLADDNHLLIRDSLNWENGIVEAPWIINENQYFYLFYSSCGYASLCYSVGVARSKDLLGPYEKYPQPILHTRMPETENSWEGPGHCSVVKTLQGKYAMIYHAWPHGEIGKTKRVMLVDEVNFEDGWPKVGKGYPSEDEQPNF